MAMMLRRSDVELVCCDVDSDEYSVFSETDSLALLRSKAKTQRAGADTRRTPTSHEEKRCWSYDN